MTYTVFCVSKMKTLYLTLPYLLKRNISQFVHISSNVRFKSHDSYEETL